MALARILRLKRPPLVTFENGLDVKKEIEREETFVGPLVRPASFDAELVAGLKPVSDLLDGCLFEIGRERVLACAESGAGQDIAAGVGDAGERKSKV